MHFNIMVEYCIMEKKDILSLLFKIVTVNEGPYEWMVITQRFHNSVIPQWIQYFSIVGIRLAICSETVHAQFCCLECVHCAPTTFTV